MTGYDDPSVEDCGATTAQGVTPCVCRLQPGHDGDHEWTPIVEVVNHFNIMTTEEADAALGEFAEITERHNQFGIAVLLGRSLAALIQIAKSNPDQPAVTGPPQIAYGVRAMLTVARGHTGICRGC